jgi:uncharacterized protein with ParB-like and HNH nuclease domain
MREIKGYERSIQELLSDGNYVIDYYQREFKWGTSQLGTLLNDLSTCFLKYYDAADTLEDISRYGHYFLGSMVVSRHHEGREVIDGQQRLTTITLLLIYLNNLQKQQEQQVDIDYLIHTGDLDEIKLRFSVPERDPCMEALYNQEVFDPKGASESVKNLYSRYADIEDLFPEELHGDSLTMFIHWLKEKVRLIEIVAGINEDAYAIFETMNGRGLSHSPTDMLTGYLLSNILDVDKRQEAKKLLKKWLVTFAEYGKETQSDFFKAWLRSQYAQKIRKRKKGAQPEDYDLIGTEYHRWVKDNQKLIGLRTSDDFHRWVLKDLDYFARVYVMLLGASKSRIKGLASVRYNADHGFTQQLQVLMAPLCVDDGRKVTKQKIALVADFLDCWLNRRLWNFKSISYSSLQQTVFLLCKDIRNISIDKLRTYLVARLGTENIDLDFKQATCIKQRSAKNVHRQLARFIDWLEQQTGRPGRYEDYIIRQGKNAYFIEHVWSEKYLHHKSEFPRRENFEEWRNMIGGLLLLPVKQTKRLKEAKYQKKLSSYVNENLLAQSLHALCYLKNAEFKEIMNKYELPFKAHDEFRKSDVEHRNQLYCLLAEEVWSAKRLVEK